MFFSSFASAKIHLFMIRKGQKLYSILHHKCPRCHEGDFYAHKLSLNYKKILATPEKCPNCGQKFHLEPSFYYGAMYVNYAITVALAIFVFLVTHLLNSTLITSFIWIVVALILGAPWVLRLSRIIWINLFIAYQDQND